MFQSPALSSVVGESGASCQDCLSRRNSAALLDYVSVLRCSALPAGLRFGGVLGTISFIPGSPAKGGYMSSFFFFLGIAAVAGGLYYIKRTSS